MIRYIVNNFRQIHKLHILLRRIAESVEQYDNPLRYDAESVYLSNSLS